MSTQSSKADTTTVMTPFLAAATLDALRHDIRDGELTVRAVARRGLVHLPGTLDTIVIGDEGALRQRFDVAHMRWIDKRCGTFGLIVGGQ